MLGAEVKRLREAKEMTLAELAASTHLGLSFVWSIEHDRELELYSWQIERLATALGVSPGHILLLIPPERRRLGLPRRVV